MLLSLFVLVQLTAKSLQAVIDILNLLILDAADISHKVSVVTSAVGNLLVDIVVAKDFVDLAEHTGDVSVNEDDL
jgi:hypothetical protein